MSIPLDLQAGYWEQEWAGRASSEKIKMNLGKVRVLINQLWSRAPYAVMEKLDIGCGTGVHAHILSRYSPYWKERWTGLDLSPVAVERAKGFGLNAKVQNFFEYDGDGKRYELFLLLDTMEHIDDHERLGSKIKELAYSEYVIFGNIPLYLSESQIEGHYERPMTIHTVKRFLSYAGCDGKFMFNVYGISGFPYMWFEGANKAENIGKQIDDSAVVSK